MASRFWVGGTGTWDNSDTTHWSATDGGAGGASVPGSSDTVTFNANSGGGTVTLNYDPTIQSMSGGNFGGTLDFGSQNMICTAAAGFSFSGTGTRTLNWSGTLTLSAQDAAYSIFTTTNATLNIGSLAVSFTHVSGSANRSFVGGGTLGSLTIAERTSQFTREMAIGSGTVTTLTVGAGVSVSITANLTATTLNLNGLSTKAIPVISSAAATQRTITTTTATMTWCAFKDITTSTSQTATNSFNLGGNGGNLTIQTPSGAGNRLSPGLG